LERMLSLSEAYRPLLRWIEIGFLSTTGFTTLIKHLIFPVEWIWCHILHRLVHPRLASMIISDCPHLWSAFPGIFSDFSASRISLLWRGSRDGFGAIDFHNRCDGHASTLAVILDTRGIFAVASLQWSGKGGNETGGSETRTTASRLTRVWDFFFTLKNPTTSRRGDSRWGWQWRILQSVVIPHAVHTFVTLLFRIIAVRTPKVTLYLGSVT
jgi:hypothetical protein